MSGRRNFTMDDETEDLLDSHDGDNHSELVRELLKAYYSPGCFDTDEAAVNVREQRLEAQLDAKRSEAEAIQSELASLREAKDDVTVPDDDKLRDALRACAGLDAEDRHTNNPAVERQAEKAGLDADAFLDVLDDEYPTDSLGNGVKAE